MYWLKSFANLHIPRPQMDTPIWALQPGFSFFSDIKRKYCIIIGWELYPFTSKVFQFRPLPAAITWLDDQLRSGVLRSCQFIWPTNEGLGKMKPSLEMTLFTIGCLTLLPAVTIFPEVKLTIWTLFINSKWLFKNWTHLFKCSIFPLMYFYR